MGAERQRESARPCARVFRCAPGFPRTIEKRNDSARRAPATTASLQQPCATEKKSRRFQVTDAVATALYASQQVANSTAQGIPGDIGRDLPRLTPHAIPHSLVSDEYYLYETNGERVAQADQPITSTMRVSWAETTCDCTQTPINPATLRPYEGMYAPCPRKPESPL